MIAMLLARIGLSSRAAGVMGVVLAGLLLVLGAIWTVHHIQAQEATIEQQRVVIDGQAAEMARIAQNAAATEAASVQREADTNAITEQTKESTDAIEKASDGVPSAAAVRLGCLRLARAGRDTSTFAACR